MSRMRVALGVVTLVVAGASAAVLAGASSDGTSSNAGSKASNDGAVDEAKAPPPPDAFTGISVAAHATDIYGPEAGFRISGWTSWGGANKLIELVADGTEVKAGDQIARFDFQGKDALTWINEKLATADAKAAKHKIEAQQVVDQLTLEKKKKELDAQLAQINVDKERSLSKRQAEIYRINKKIADFEVRAITERIASAEKENEAEKQFEDLNVSRAHGDLDHYAFYEKRFVVKAPHDGVVRHAFNGNERRKVQKGDSIQSGVKVMSVAKDAALAVRFFVPEHRIREVAVGSIVVVTTPGSAVERRAVVSSIDYFPQEIGFLLDNNNLPNAREKAFSVKADFQGATDGLSAGTELVVKAATP